MEEIRRVVKKKYADAITQRTGCCSGGATQCCEDKFTKATDPITRNLYGAEEVVGLPKDVIANSFGCGNPTALAQLNPGDVVLDLGSGAGLDVLLSARRVGPTGKAYGLDMTDEMLTVARENQKKSGIENAEFLKGHIEEIPLSDNTVDVIISNCVINLSADKNKVLAEAFRVLKPGGKFAVSDIVLKKPLPSKVQQDLLAWAGCIAGALLEEEYKDKLATSGFEEIEVQVTRNFDMTSPEAQSIADNLTEEERQQLKGAIVSAFVRAIKP